MNYSTVCEREREIRISQATFLKTSWCLNKGKGPTTTIPPEGIKTTRDVWSGKIKAHDLQSQLLTRNGLFRPNVAMRMEDRYINSIAGYLQGLPFPYNDKNHR